MIHGRDQVRGSCKPLRHSALRILSEVICRDDGCAPQLRIALVLRLPPVHAVGPNREGRAHRPVRQSRYHSDLMTESVSPADSEASRIQCVAANPLTACARWIDVDADQGGDSVTYRTDQLVLLLLPVGIFGEQASKLFTIGHSYKLVASSSPEKLADGYLHDVGNGDDLFNELIVKTRRNVAS